MPDADSAPDRLPAAASDVVPAVALRVRRRRGVRVVAGVVVVCGLALSVFAVVAGVAFVRAGVSTVGTLAFEQPLRVPPLEDGVVDADGVRRFELEVREGVSEFVPGVVTPTWGVNGDFLGPTLRMWRGERVRVDVVNTLGVDTSMHWHGMHVPAVMDGGPHQSVPAGGVWSPSWLVDQPAASLWYHPHPHGRTAEHVYRGVAGMIVVDDGEVSGLPDVYGVDDFPLIVQDRKFDADGGFGLRPGFMGVTGVLGDTLLVNGTFDPHLEVSARRVRLRLLNASNARFFEFGFADGREFALVGTDGGLLERPVSLSRVPLSPGERAEVVVEFEPGERVVLRSFARQVGNRLMSPFAGGRDSFDVLEFRAAGVLTASAPLPEVLPGLGPLTAPEGARVREFVLGGNDINGRTMDMGRVDAVVDEGAVEVWRVRNRSGLPHNFHVHGVQFWVVEVDGGPPPVWMVGAKDTVEVDDGVEVVFVVGFDVPADPVVPFMFHCHVLSHEDAGMMGQFVVVPPGGRAGPVDHSRH